MNDHVLLTRLRHNSLSNDLMRALFGVNGGRSRRANAIIFTTIAADVSLDQHKPAEQSDRPEWVGSENVESL